MRFRINNRFHKSLRTRSLSLERPILSERGEDAVPVGFLEFDDQGFVRSIQKFKKFMWFPAVPIRPDIATHQPFMTDFDYRVEISPPLRLAIPNQSALEDDDNLRNIWQNAPNGYYNWLTNETGHSHKFFTESTIMIADRFVENPDTPKSHKYRVIRTETIGTVQDIFLHDIENVH